MNNTCINILILGKTGSGKSSFCNYIFGDNLFRTGSGKPVTNWSEHFECEQINYNDFNLNIFDSVGIETDNLEQWQTKLEQLIYKRNTKNFNPNEWIHGAFYVINAASARVEDNEINIIQDLLKNNITVSVILTNADSAREDVKNELKKVITDRVLRSNTIENIFSSAFLREYTNSSEITKFNFRVHEVCSVNARRRTGYSVQFGREEVLNSFLQNLDSSLCKGSLLRIIKMIDSNLLKLKDMMRSEIKKLDLGVIKVIKGAIQDNLDNVLSFDDKLIDDIREQYDTYIDGFESFLHKVGYVGNSITLKNLNALLNGFEKLKAETESNLEKKLDSIGGGLDSDSTWENIKSIFKVTGVLFTLESTILEVIDDMFHPLFMYLYEAEYTVETTSCYIKIN